MSKEYFFESPDDFAFNESGIGLIVSGDKKATVDLFNKTAEIEWRGKIYKLINVDFNIQIERLDVSIITLPRRLTHYELIIKAPDVVISGDLVNE